VPRATSANTSGARVQEACARPLDPLDFDYTCNREIPKARIWELAGGRYLEERASIPLCGPTGVGKTLIAQALGVQICPQRRRVVFTKPMRSWRTWPVGALKVTGRHAYVAI
jgi:DNA replication protein DnaC